MRWLFANVRNKARYAAQNPGYAVRALLREASRADEKFLSAITGSSVRKLRAYLDEPLDDPAFSANLRDAEKSAEGLDDFGADLYAKKVLVQYAAIRAFRPETVVETGVANGVSSSYILLALEKNQLGTLHSIDIGTDKYLPPGKTVGWTVPQFLRHRWDLRIGDSKTLLPELLASLRSTDVFIHDSLHVYDHMLWEYRTAFPFIKPGGLFFSDDALWNDAFPEFVVEAGAKEHAIVRGVGILKKPQAR